MSKTQIVLATGEVYDVEDKGERRILIPVGCIKQEEEKHEQSDFNGTFNTGSAGEIHTGQDSMAIARFTLAVDRRGRKQEGQQDADFPSCVAFGKSAEFVEKYVHQGTKIVLTGRIQTGSYTNKDNIKVYTTEVIAEDIEFAESKAAAEGSGGAGGHQKPEQTENDGFMNIPEGIDEELPFN